ncbi:MAG TPA: hypothetical protein VFS75_03105 [Candidatus Paceibacterota bacterium]|nr:hypothetical protein [Candidatus Paceibacterota bacterium]
MTEHSRRPALAIILPQADSPFSAARCDRELVEPVLEILRQSVVDQCIIVLQREDVAPGPTETHLKNLRVVQQALYREDISLVQPGDSLAESMESCRIRAETCGADALLVIDRGAIPHHSVLLHERRTLKKSEVRLVSVQNAVA